MRRSPMPARVIPFRRDLATVTIITGGGQVIPFQRRAPISPVSKRRARQNRRRAVMADRLWPDRRDGAVLCAVPGCGQPADDLHEPLSRARGGGIVDENNCVPLCRADHDALTFRPESELRWAYACGLLQHSYNDPDGAA